MKSNSKRDKYDEKENIESKVQARFCIKTLGLRDEGISLFNRRRDGLVDPALKWYQTVYNT